MKSFLEFPFFFSNKFSEICFSLLVKRERRVNVWLSQWGHSCGQMLCNVRERFVFPASLLEICMLEGKKSTECGRLVSVLTEDHKQKCVLGCVRKEAFFTWNLNNEFRLSLCQQYCADLVGLRPYLSCFSLNNQACNVRCLMWYVVPWSDRGCNFFFLIFRELMGDSAGLFKVLVL